MNVGFDESQRAEDPIIFFTLIDFLIQLLLLGLFSASVWAFHAAKAEKQASQIKELPAWTREQQYLPILEGLSPLVNAENAKELTELLQRLDEDALKALVKFLSASDDPLQVFRFCAENTARCKALLNQCARSDKLCENFANSDPEKLQSLLNRAPGRPACIESKPRSLFTLLATSDGIKGERVYEVTAVSDVGRVWFEKMGVSLSVRQNIKDAQFADLFGPFSPKKIGCVHFIDYRSKTDSDSMRREVENWFYVDPK
jgi:hypothetical protein